MAVDAEKVMQALVDGEVKFILIGGLAAIVHGSPRLTEDVDVVYARGRDNIRRLVEALRPFSPYLRGAPRGLPFTWDERTVRMGLNFTLDTTLGDVDVLGEVIGGRTYEELLPHSAEAMLFPRYLSVVRLNVREDQASHSGKEIWRRYQPSQTFWPAPRAASASSRRLKPPALSKPVPVALF